MPPLTQILQVVGGAGQDTNNDGSGAGGVGEFPADNIAGNTIIVLGGISGPKTVSQPEQFSIHDDQGNTYNSAIFAGALGTDGVSCQINYANGIKPGPNKIYFDVPVDTEAGWGFAYTVIELQGTWKPDP